MRIGFHSLLSIVITIVLIPYTPLVAQSIVQTEIVSIGAMVGSIPSIDTGGGGGGSTYQSGVRFSGYAYPNATVTVQVRDVPLLTVQAQDSGQFSVVIPETDWQLFTLFATDTFGRRSTVLNFPTVLYSGYITDISGIRFAPTITTDKVAVKKGDFISIEGSATPRSTVALMIEGVTSQPFSFVANNDGVYSATIPITLPEGEYTLRARYPQDSRTSRALRLTVGAASLFRVETTKNIPGDCNVDQRVTLVDFSVLAYWYGKPNPPQCVDTNKDGIITLVDFSILAFYWNG